MYPKQYIQYLVHFHSSRDYFECHEILEEYWKQTDEGNKQSILVAFILLAVSSYHYRRENFSGAEKCLRKSIKIFKHQPDEWTKYGINREQFDHLLTEILHRITERKAYTSFNFPIEDEKLIKQCIQLSQKYGLKWQQHSEMGNLHLIHRHKERDRTDVIEARKEALLRKKELCKSNVDVKQADSENH